MLRRVLDSFRAVRPAAGVLERSAVHRGPLASPPAQYPPFDAGLPLVSIADLLAEHAEILRRIKLAYGAEQVKFDEDLKPIIERFAAYVHLLPATPTNYFRAPAGLLRMSLEVAFYSVQAVDSTLFQGLKTITQRQHLEPRWRLATFIAGLCSELHRTIGHVVVTNDGGLEWPPYLGPLFDWSQKLRAERYHLRWVDNQQESRGSGLFALPHIVSMPTLQFLAAGNSVVVPHMLASATGTPVYRGTSNVLDSLVRRSVALVVDTELRSNADFYGQHQLGAHLERYLVDALRRLVASGEWVVNGPNSPVWHGTEGVFLVWPRAGDEVVRLLDRDQLTGIPKNSETILEILVSAGVVEKGEDGAGPLRQILPPSMSQPLNAVRLVAESIITSALPVPVTPIDGNLAVVSADAKSTSVPAIAVALHRPAQSVTASNSTQEVLATHHQRLPNLELSGSPKSTTAPVPFATAAVVETPPQSSASDTSAPPATPSLIAQPAAVRIPIADASLSLRASPRLNPSVQLALSNILSTVPDSARREAIIVPGGVFVPLEAFTRRDVDTATAVESLDSVGLLARSQTSNSKTVRSDFNGQPVVGVLIRSDHVAGFPAEISIHE